MRRHLKNYFIPHPGNDHQPHFLRDASIGVVVAIVCVVTIASGLLLVPSIATKLNYLATILPAVLVAETNASRVEVGQNELMTNATLAYAAQLKANDMAEKGYFAHVSPDGTTPWYWIQKAGYAYSDAGENLAVNFVDSEEVHNAWMNSPTHRANILRDGFTEIGIATASGMYNGRPAIFVAQYFGKPRVTLVQVTVAEPVSNVTPVAAPLASTTTVASIELEPEVLGEQYISTTTMVSSVHQLTWYERAAAAPRTTLLWLLGIIAGIVSVALLLKIFVVRHIQYPKLIINGVLAVTIIIVLMGVSEMMGGIMSGVI
jgi:hypothetical protein